MIIDNDTAFNLALTNGKLSLQVKDNVDLKLCQTGPVISLDISHAPRPHLDDEECTQTWFKSPDRKTGSESFIDSDLFDNTGIKKSTRQSFQDHQLLTESSDDENQNPLTSSSAPSSKTKEKFDVIDRSIKDFFTLVCTCTLWKILQSYIHMCHCYIHSRWAVVPDENGFESLHCFDGDVTDTDDYFMQKPQMQRAIRHGEKGEVSVNVYGNMYVLPKIAKPSITFEKHIKDLPIKSDNGVATENHRAVLKIEEDMIGSITDASLSQIANVSQRSRRPSTQQTYREIGEKSCLNGHTISDIIAPKSMLVSPYDLVEGEDGQYEITDVAKGFKEWLSAKDTANYMKMFSTVFEYKNIEYTGDQAISLTDDLQKTSITNRTKRQALGYQAPALPDFVKEYTSSLPTKVDNAYSPNQMISKTVGHSESDIRLTTKADILKKKSIRGGHDFEKRECGNVTEKAAQQPTVQLINLGSHSENNGIESTLNDLQRCNINGKETTRKTDAVHHRFTVNKNVQPHKKKSPSTLRLYPQRPYKRQTTDDKGNGLFPKERRIFVDDHISTGSVESLPLSSEGKGVEVPRQSELDTSWVCKSRLESKGEERNTLLHVQEGSSQTTTLPVYNPISKTESDHTSECKVSSCPDLMSSTPTYQCTRPILQADMRKHPHSSGDIIEITKGHRSCVEKEFKATSYIIGQRIYDSGYDDFLALDPGGKWGGHPSEKQDGANSNGCANPESEKGNCEKLTVTSTVVPYHENDADRIAATFRAARIKVPSASLTGVGIPSVPALQKSKPSPPVVPQGPPNKVGEPPVSANKSSRDLASANIVGVPQASTDKVDIPQISATMVSIPSTSADKVGIPWASTDKVDIPHVSTDKVDIPQVSTDMVDMPEASADKVDIPQASADKAGIQSTSADKVGIPSTSADEVGIPSASAINVGIPSTSADKIPSPSKAGIPSTSANKVGLPSTSASVVGTSPSSATNVGMPSVTGIGIHSPAVDDQLQIHCSGCLEIRRNTHRDKTLVSLKRNNEVTETNVAPVDVESKADCSHGGSWNPDQKTQDIQKFNNEGKAEEKRNAFSGDVKSCNCCVSEILEHAGSSMNVIKVKEHIIHEMCSRPGRPPLKTVYGLAVWCLPDMKQWEIEKLTGYPWPSQETHVHNVLNELKHQGLKLGHVVQYFSQEDRKRLDILQLIAEIHPDCPYCSAQITEFR